MTKNIKFICYTAILIAVTLTFQLSSRIIFFGPFSNFITGSIVNTCLIISTSYVGPLCASIVGIITPFAALLTGSPAPIFFMPFIALCNISLIISFYFLRTKKIINIIIPAIVINSIKKISGEKFE